MGAVLRGASYRSRVDIARRHLELLSMVRLC